jgi:UDP-galactopyranose mutase
MANSIDLVCFSHLRWGFVFQRPNHLMSRFARIGRVFFIEEPIYDEGPIGLESVEAIKNLWVCTPHINSATSSEMAEAMQRRLFDGLIRKHRIVSPVEWFYTPMALPLATHLDPSLVVYDCMDELSGFHGAPPELLEREERLFGHADVVFAGGSSLYESKRTRHPEVFLFPSSVDDAHFASARTRENDPPDQAPIGFPRVGFFGVIDERMDLALIESLARRRPQY